MSARIEYKKHRFVTVSQFQQAVRSFPPATVEHYHTAPEVFDLGKGFFRQHFFSFREAKVEWWELFPYCLWTSVRLNELSISKAGLSITKLVDTVSAASWWSKGERLVLKWFHKFYIVSVSFTKFICLFLNRSFSPVFLSCLYLGSWGWWTVRDWNPGSESPANQISCFWRSKFIIILLVS